MSYRRNGYGRSASNASASSDASPFIKPDRNRRNFLRARMNPRGGSANGFVKKEDPEFVVKKENELLGVENVNGPVLGKKQVKSENDEVYNEFPLRAVSKEALENMRTHLLKFQSKKVINPQKNFHLPIRLHRKDTRNLQFQLTRAEIVQRQKEIAEYKKTGTAGVSGKAENNANVPPAPNSSGTPAPGTFTPGTAGASQETAPTSAADTPATAPATNTPQQTPTAAATVTNLSGTATTPTLNANGTTAGNDQPNVILPTVTQLEVAGTSEDPTKVGMVKYDGKESLPDDPINNPNGLGAEDGTIDPLADVAPDGGGRAKRGNIRRKTRQIKVLDEKAKKLRFEEFYPWVMEDYDGYNTWVGSYEAGNSDSYVLLSVEDDGSFTMIPADKVYKFTARNKYATLTIDEAEKRMDKKSGEVPRWLMKHLDNIGTTTTRYDRTKRRLKAINDQKRNIEGSESEHDDNSEVELDYDEEFADDEEAPIIDGNEQENKESEKRIKQEMLQANALGLHDDETANDNEDLNDEGLFNEKKIDENGERIKKALQKTELAALYSDDDGEINPYLSESDLENKDEENKSPVKKEDSDNLNQSKSKNNSPKKQQQNANKKIDDTTPQIRVKSIKNCILVLKADKSVLKNFAPGQWNPNVKRRKIEVGESDTNTSITTQNDAAINSNNIGTANAGTDEIVSVKSEESGAFPLITEQDIINAIGTTKVNVKEFGKLIRKKYPGAENKKRMFAIVKKLCRKVDNERMELKI